MLIQGVKLGRGRQRPEAYTRNDQKAKVGNAVAETCAVAEVNVSPKRRHARASLLGDTLSPVTAHSHTQGIARVHVSSGSLRGLLGTHARRRYAGQYSMGVAPSGTALVRALTCKPSGSHAVYNGTSGRILKRGGTDSPPTRRTLKVRSRKVRSVENMRRPSSGSGKCGLYSCCRRSRASRRLFADAVGGLARGIMKKGYEANV